MSSDARPFEHTGDHRGILCVHGFTGTPFEMHVLGRRLAARGFTVKGPLLAGHGGDPRDMNATGWRDWFATVEEAFDELKGRCERVGVVGLSLGSLLSLHLARMRPGEVRVLGALGTPLWLPGYARAAIPAVSRLAARVGRLQTWPKMGGQSDIRDEDMRDRNPAMPVFPVRALESLLDFTRIVRAEVEMVTCPTFVAHGRHDHTAPLACSDELYRRLPSRDKRLLVLDRSYHVITIDVEREALADAICDFFVERM